MCVCSYFVAAGLCIPLGLLSLGGNMALQWVSTLGQMLFSLYFVVHYLQGLPKASPRFCPGNGPSRTPLVGGDLSQVCTFTRLDGLYGMQRGLML